MSKHQLANFEATEIGYVRTEPDGRWLVEQHQYSDGGNYWQIMAEGPGGSISVDLERDPLDDDAISAHLGVVPSIARGVLAVSSWFARLEAITGGDVFVIDRWLKNPLRKSEATPEQLARRAAFLDAVRAMGWQVQDAMLANFDADIAQSPDVIASHETGEVNFFVMSNMIEAYAGGVFVRMLAPKNIDASLRSLEPLIANSAKGAVEWITRAHPLHDACMLRGPDGDWLEIGPPVEGRPSRPPE